MATGNMGALVLELQGNIARIEKDMREMSRVVGDGMKQIDRVAATTSRNISAIGAAGGGIKRIEGAREAANDIEKVGHASTGARREILVLAHEISQGNFKRAAGSLMVLGERMDWMGKIMSPMGLTVGLVAVAMAGLAIAAYKGAEAVSEFNRAQVLTGGYANVTIGRFNEMSRSVAEASNTTIGNAHEITQALLETGRFGGDSLGHVAAAAASFAAVSGQKAEEVVKNFEKMSGGALKWALEMDRQTHFMTGALYDQIKALEDAGKKNEAMIVAADALNAAFHRQTDAINGTGGSWQSFKNWVSDATHEVEKFLSGSYTLEDRIAAVKQSLVNAPKEGGLLSQGVQRGAQRTDLTRQLGSLTSSLRSQQLNADLIAAQKNTDEEIVNDKESWNKRIEAHHEGQAAMNRDIATARREGKNAGASQGDIDAEVERIRKSYEHHGGGNIARADLSADLKPLQDQISAEDRLLSYREKSLAGYYKRDQISIEGYYTTRQTVIEANATRVAALYDKEIAAEEKYANSTKGAAHIQALTHANALRDQQEQAATRTSEQLAQLTEEKASATDHYREEVEKLTSELDKLNNRQGNSAGADFDRTHQKLSDQATAAGDTGTLDTLAQARTAAVAQGQMNTLKKEATVITEALGTTEKRIALQEQLDQKTELQGTIDTMKARADAAQQLDQIAGKMTAVANDSGMPTLIADAQKFKLQTDQVGASVDILGKSVQDNLANGFATVFDNTINRTKTLKQSFLDFTNSIEQSLLKLISQDLFSQLFSIGGSAGGGAGGSGTSFLAQLVGMLGSSSGSAAAGAGVEVGGAMDMAMPVVTAALASGGPASAGSMYQVNERGPELLTVANKTFLMMGDQPGKVTPTGDAGNGGSGRNTFNMNIAVPAGTTRQTAQQQASAIMRQAQIAMARNN